MPPSLRSSNRKVSKQVFPELSFSLILFRNSNSFKALPPNLEYLNPWEDMVLGQGMQETLR